jgi:hypothetical protein
VTVDTGPTAPLVVTKPVLLLELLIIPVVTLSLGRLASIYLPQPALRSSSSARSWIALAATKGAST